MVRKPLENIENVKDKSLIFNTDLVETLEFENLICKQLPQWTRLIIKSRGDAEDLKRDEKFMQHTLSW